MKWKWADKFKKKTPEPTEEQVQAKNKEILDNATVVTGDLVVQKDPKSQRPDGPAPTPPEKSSSQKPEGVAPTLPQKFTGDYASIDELMKVVDAKIQAENTGIKSKDSNGKGSPATDKTEYGAIPDALTMKLYEATDSKETVDRLEKQLDKVTKDMSEVTIKTKEGIKIDSFKPSLDIIRDELYISNEKADKFGKAMESAAKEPDLAKQDKMIKDAVKDVVQGHKTDLMKQMDEVNKSIASNILKDAKYTSTNKDLPEKGRPTGKDTGQSR